MVKDVVVFTILSERKLGPKLHAVFAEGRLEEFVPSRKVVANIGQKELVSCSSDYSTRWLAIKKTFNNV
jgi:hypothetical protein